MSRYEIKQDTILSRTGTMSTAAATGAVGTATTIFGYLKQIVTDTAANFLSVLGLVEKCVEKSDGAVLNGADDLFTITGGPVLGMLVGIVTTDIGATVATGQLKITTTSPAGTVNLSTAVNIETDAAGTSYRFVGATGVLTPVTAGAKIIDPVTVGDCWFLLPAGTVTFTGSAADTGNIKWYLRYKPLSPSAAVVAAA